MRPSIPWLAPLLLTLLTLSAADASASVALAHSEPPPGLPGPADTVASPLPSLQDVAGTWLWPVSGERRVVSAFQAPAHRYGPGHRGIDIVANGAFRAPAAGVVVFVGRVVDRDVLTIDHGDGLVSTFDPIRAEVPVGQVLARGDRIGTSAEGGHTDAAQVHFGVRFQDEYVNPLLLLGEVPRAILLPCCE